MRRAVELAAQRIPVSEVRRAAQICRTLCWEIRDYRLRAYLLFREDGTIGYSTSSFAIPEGSVSMESSLLHQAAFGDTSALAIAFLTGQVRVTGGPAENLDFFLPFLKPFLEGYRQACEELAGTSLQ